MTFDDKLGVRIALEEAKKDIWRTESGPQFVGCGVEVVNMDDEECKKIMADFIRNRPRDWNEDIGEQPP
ncbi:hypothetical protein METBISCDRAFT_26479 [Metschnikowia bicuspidata]|uniref:Uncharacterized protein n=1 Tax=Metschnikowia bicuspidata TaxID=27322 RepID=A0A4P9ZFA5_9ASCO|nr:hypothetical protein METBISCDRAFT_26479 [Metschnikowia bicuspidata]